MKIYIGVCAFKKRYYSSPIRCVELQRTFYNIPQEKTVKKWRDEAPKDFVFNIKVFQGLTHDAKSPTWRRYTKKLSSKEKELVGNLRLNDLTKGWIRTYIRFAKILDAEVLIVQTSARFSPTKENIENAKKFFQYCMSVLDEEKVKTWIGWEPRGKWLENTSKLREIIEEFDRLIHIVDPFFHKPVTIKKVVYFRLHGKPYLNYKYQYTDNELRDLANKVEGLPAEKAYFMFNNVYMEEDAQKFARIIGEKQ